MPVLLNVWHFSGERKQQCTRTETKSRGTLGEEVFALLCAEVVQTGGTFLLDPFVGESAMDFPLGLGLTGSWKPKCLGMGDGRGVFLGQQIL